MACASIRRTPAVNVRLRPLAGADAAWCDAWLPALTASIGCTGTHFAGDLIAWSRDDRRASAAVIERDGVPAGVGAWRDAAPSNGAGVIELVAMPSSEARRGAGMTAAALIERELRASGARRVYAPVPASHGIAMYFWIRLGYHPLLRPAWPEERPGFGWMARDLP